MLAKDICHHVRVPQFITESEVKFSKEILSPYLLQSELLLGGEAARHHVVSEDYEVGAEEVVGSFLYPLEHVVMFLLLGHEGCGHLSSLGVQCRNLLIHLLADGFIVGGLCSMLLF